MSTADDSIMEFPCEFPVKVMGYATQEFELEVIQIFRKHVPDLSENAVKRRESSANKYAALTVTITATSRDQLDNIYQDLTASEAVIMAL